MPYERYPLITEEKLVPYHDAFTQTGEESAQTQSAVLLIVGTLLGDRATFPQQEMTREQTAAELFPVEDWAALAIPDTLLDLHKHRGTELSPGLLTKELGPAEAERLEGARDFRIPEAEQRFVEVQVSLSESLARSPTPESAARLVENSLNHPQPLVRIAATSAALDLFSEDATREDLIGQLFEGLGNEDDLVRDLAATILARIDPDHPKLAALTEGGARPSPIESPHTSMLIHGTWARNNSWWQPGGDFHSYILSNVDSNLYAQPDRYEWSGGWSDDARSLAATQLEAWVTAHNLAGLNLICHSHGGSVAMEANQSSLQLKQLVLLSCPVHTDKYLPNFNQVSDVVSIRVKFDLVILADGGGQKYEVDGIRENKLPIWFNHSASHDPDVWQDYDVPALL